MRSKDVQKHGVAVVETGQPHHDCRSRVRYIGHLVMFLSFQPSCFLGNSVIGVAFLTGFDAMRWFRLCAYVGRFTVTRSCGDSRCRLFVRWLLDYYSNTITWRSIVHATCGAHSDDSIS
ncbi:hypothetical protein BDZ85DRAFT_107456 [Elsinoe ampelina]|uniref:Uncharacterized protein n=1 Tax=Elsinoe ampelina TaxID=302913 RepID=A0A6A6GC60_9PEZI|nr:hypothetical protein BDZ85DRAFT_107456 [Elsinoe ampelina]